MPPKKRQKLANVNEEGKLLRLFKEASDDGSSGGESSVEESDLSANEKDEEPDEAGSTDVSVHDPYSDNDGEYGSDCDYQPDEDESSEGDKTESGSEDSEKSTSCQRGRKRKTNTRVFVFSQPSPEKKTHEPKDPLALHDTTPTTSHHDKSAILPSQSKSSSLPPRDKPIASTSHDHAVPLLPQDKLTESVSQNKALTSPLSPHEKSKAMTRLDEPTHVSTLGKDTLSSLQHQPAIPQLHDGPDCPVSQANSTNSLSPPQEVSTVSSPLEKSASLPIQTQPTLASNVPHQHQPRTASSPHQNDSPSSQHSPSNSSKPELQILPVTARNSPLKDKQIDSLSQDRNRTALSPLQDSTVPHSVSDSSTPAIQTLPLTSREPPAKDSQSDSPPQDQHRTVASSIQNSSAPLPHSASDSSTPEIQPLPLISPETPAKNSPNDSPSQNQHKIVSSPVQNKSIPLPRSPSNSSTPEIQPSQKSPAKDSQIDSPSQDQHITVALTLQNASLSDTSTPETQSLPLTTRESPAKDNQMVSPSQDQPRPASSNVENVSVPLSPSLPEYQPGPSTSRGEPVIDMLIDETASFPSRHVSPTMQQVNLATSLQSDQDAEFNVRVIRPRVPIPSSPINQYDWEDTTAPIQEFRFDTTSCGPTVPFDETTGPVDILEHLFTPEILNHVVTCTNAYGAALCNTNRPHTRGSRYRSFKPTDSTEMKKFLGLCLLQGHVEVPHVRKLFTQTDPFYYHPLFPLMMSGRRFEQLLRYLCVTEQLNCTGMDKIRALATKMIANFQAVNKPDKQLSLDESLLAFRGRLSFRTYMKSKKKKYGIKFYVLTTYDGYVLNFVIYEGKDTVIDESQSKLESLVMNLMRPYLNKGHELYMDNFYNSVNLSNKLLELDTHTTGTLRKDRKGNPKEMFKKTLKKGDHFWQRKRKVYVSVWKDKRPVYMITTKHHPRLVTARNRFGKEKIKPVEVKEYNKYMSGIDRADQMLAYYSTPKRTLRWPKKVFFHLLDLAVSNAFYLYKKHCEPKATLLKFRESIIRSYLGLNDHDDVSLLKLRPTSAKTHSSRRKRTTNMANAQSAESSETGQGHWPELIPVTENAKRNKAFLKCRVCTKNKITKQTSFRCKTCIVKPPLCPSCFEAWHTDPRFRSQTY